MRIPAALLILVVALPLAVAQRPSLVGGFLPVRDLGPLQGNKARSFDRLVGRTVLIEFFAYW